MERKSEGEFRKLPSPPKFWLKSFSTRASQTHPSSRHAQITKWAGLIVPPPLSPPFLPPPLIIFAEVPETPPRPRSMAPPASRNSGSGGGGGSGTGVSSGGWGDAPLARALFAYLSSGENQLSFLEGDLIALMGEWMMSGPRISQRRGIIIRPDRNEISI